MKKISIFCFVLLSIEGLAGQSSLKEGIQKKIIKEKKSVQIFENVNGQGGVTDSIMVSRALFDKNGRPVKEVTYDNNGSPVLISEYQYDAKGQKIKVSISNEQIHMRNDFSYKYDPKGNVIEETAYENGTEIEYKKIYKYNSNGKKTMELKVNEEKEMVAKNTFDYDQNGNLIKANTFNEKDSVTLSYVYKYDSNNNVIEEIRYDGKVVGWKYQYEYDSNNQKIKEVHTYPYETSNSTIRFQYDADKHLIEEVTYNYKNQVILKKSFRYESNKLIEETTGSLKTIYEYDPQGNKIKEAEYSASGLSIKTFNSKGDLLSFIQYGSDQKFSYQEIYQYDPVTDLKMKMSKVNNDQTVSEEYEYKYNKYGDLTEEIKKNKNSGAISKNKFLYEYNE